MGQKSRNPGQLDLFDDWLVVASPAPQATPEPVAEPAPTTEPLPPEIAATPVSVPNIDESRYHLAVELAAQLNSEGAITSAFLTQTANRIFGGTQSEGTYSPKDAYDAMEAAFNLHLLTTESGNWIDGSAGWAQAKAGELTARILHLPTQTRRDPEMDEFQQFSTPPALAFIANWVANIRPVDRMMEPSAGTGDLAVWSRIAGADVVLNELAPRRHALLAQLFPDATLFRENAEQLDNVLPTDTIPTAIVMNPPFSSTAGRVHGQRSTANGARHLEQALRRLADGGRLVAIVGQGMAHDRPAFRPWWREIEAKYNVRANVGIAGREYAKYGTSFDNQILVIDKTGPTTRAVLTGHVAAVLELPALLEDIRNDRKHLQRAPVESTSRGDIGEGRDSIRPEPGIGRAGSDSRGARSESIGDGNDPRAVPIASETVGESVHGNESDDGIGTRNANRDSAPGEPGGSGGDDFGGADSDVDGSATGIAVAATEAVAAEFTDSVFARYMPQRLSIPDAHAHPGKLVQSAAMSAVEPPAPTYTPALPTRVVRQGLLSIAQLESIVYAGQAHSEVLPNGSRRGFFIGDGTGVGKGREISGIILDQLGQGRKKAVWVSFNAGLINDARRDYSSIGGNPESIFFQGATKAGNSLAQSEGILFTTYSTLRGGEKKQATDLGQKGGQSRLQQMIDWLGKDFDGVIAFDEAHSMGNAVAIKGKRGVRKPSQQAIAGINLQRELPNARVVYVSATGATEVSNLSYADRLGLWGEGTPFADSNAFINGVSAGGIASMELISRDMKALGMYMARSLSYDGVSYERLEHTLSPLQEDIYNELAGAWQVVLNNVEAALEITQADKSGPGKSAALAQFWGAHQRFFNQIITALQTPAVIEHIKEQLDAGHAAVIQIVNTNEAAQERLIADAMANDTDLEDLDFTPRQMLMDYVRNGFPVAAFEEATDDNGNKVYRPVKDAEGDQVFDREAIALRDALLDNLTNIRVPENPLDSIINAFGSNTVAEVTGRGRRFVQLRDDDGNLKVVEEKRGKNSSQFDAEQFQADKKRILVFSGAGGTGYSFHADNTAVNTRKRIHYILQPGWRADAAVQGFGRTHRTNQATEPHYVLPTTNLKAQKRFVSSIARRLDQLGALTRGQRQATSQGMFTAADNLESEYAKSALYTFFVDLYQGRTGLNFQSVTREMGLNLLDRDGGFEQSKIPDIPQFLNRLLSLKTDQQNAVFGEFETRLVEAVEYAKQRGLFDEGLQTLRALSIHKTRDEVAYQDPKTGAQTRYVELAITNALHYQTWDEIAAIANHRQQQQPGSLSGWFVSEHGRNKDSVFFMADLGQRLNPEGEQVRRGVIYGLNKSGHRYIDNADVIHRGWEYHGSTKVTLARQIDATDAEPLWNAQLEVLPKTETTTSSMLVGVILPIWDRVTGSETIYRLQTDDGEQLLGRLLGPEAAKQTLKNLGLDSATAKLSTAELFAAIQAGQRAVLSNGWEVSLAAVNREERVEVKGRLSDAERRVLTQQGAFVERINWQERVFIPAGDTGLFVFERITASKPVVDLFQKGRGTTEGAADASVELSARLPEPSRQPVEGSRTQPTIPQINELFRKDQAMELKKPFHEVVAEKLIEQLKAGVAPWQRPWEPGEPGGFLPVNPTTGKRYKGINAIHLMSQGRTDNRWMTYKQAAAAGAQVRKGEKGTSVQYWKFSEEQEKRDEHGKPVLDGDGKSVKQTVMLERPRVFFATVFSAEQIEGLPLIERKEQAWDAVERAEHILQASGAVIRHGENNRAFYRPATDSIHLPDRGQFPTADNYYATALHELGHWTGHESRLDRDLVHPFGSEGYAMEELRAEIASMIVGDELGIGHDPGQHVAYVGSWIKALEDDPLEVFRAAAEAEKIKDYVVAFEQKQVQDQGQAQEQDVQQQPTVAELTATQHKAMKLADQAFQAELVRVYGEKDAGERRYQLHHDDPAVRETKETYTIATYQWREAMALARQTVAERDEAQAIPTQELSMQAGPDDATDQAAKAVKAEAWTLDHLERGTLPRALDTARLEQIDKALDLLDQMQPLNTQNAFWTRHELPADVDALDANIQASIEPLEQIREEAKVAEAWKAGDMVAFDAAANEAFGAPLPHDWNGNIQVQASAEYQVDGETHVAAAVDIDAEPQFWSVYAQHEDGRYEFLRDFDRPQEAEHLAERLAVVVANSTDNEHERVAVLACAHEDRVRRDPNSTEEEVLAAKEARKLAEMNVTLNDADMQKRIAELDKQAADQMSAGIPAQDERAYINVPYKEKDEAKSLGAKWDRKEQSWYVPPGVDTAPFAKWAQGATQEAAPARQAEKPVEAQGSGQKAVQERVYLAVPYGERTAAKAAGADWDKAAKSWYAGPKANMEKLQRWLPDNVPAQQAPAMSPNEEFADALRSVGCVVSGEHPIMDGKKHRISVEGEKFSAKAGSGFYVGHLDGHPAGYIKNNKTGIEMKWKSKGYSLDPEEKARLAAAAANKLAARADEQDRLHEATAQRVGKQMDSLVPASELTPYMRDKGIQTHGGALTDKDGQKTYIPAFDVDGKQWTMQYIQEDGTKRFAKDSKKEGCFHPVGGMDALAKAPALVISEGYATAATNAETLGFATVAAFDSGNLPAVARALHVKFPDKPVIIAGDDDRHLEATQGINPGRTKAEEAAKAVGGKAMFPIFAPGEQSANPKGFTDFNDLATKSELGKEGVERQVRAEVGRVIRDAEEKRERVQEQEKQVQEQRPKRASRIA